MQLAWVLELMLTHDYKCQALPRESRPEAPTSNGGHAHALSLMGP